MDVRRPGGWRIRLGMLLACIALLAVVFAAGAPAVRRVLGRPNRWEVRTETRSDGKAVRVRIRRYPDRVVRFEEVIADPGRSTQTAGPR